MSELVIPKPTLWFPRYACPQRPHGLVPPSPPAEQRAKQRKAILKAVRTFTGRLPEGWYFSRIGTPGSMQGGMQSLTGVETGLYGTNNPLASLTDAAFYYKLDTTGWLDSTAGANTLTPANSPTNPAGKVGNCVGLARNDTNGTSSYLTAAYNAAYDMSATDCTFNLWVFISSRPNPTDSYACDLIRKGRSTGINADWGLVYDDISIRFTFRYAQASDLSDHSDTLSTFGAPSLSTWYMFTYRITYLGSGNAASRNALINNGSSQNFVADMVSGLANQTANVFNIGRSQADNYRGLNGSIDEVGGWKRRITDAEVALLYNSGNGATVFP